MRCCSWIQHLSANCGLGNLGDNRLLQVLELFPFHFQTCGLTYNISRSSTIGPDLRWQCKLILKTWQENLSVRGEHCNTEAEYSVAKFYLFDWKLNLIWADKKQQIPWEFSQVAEVCHGRSVSQQSNWKLIFHILLGYLLFLTTPKSLDKSFLWLLCEILTSIVEIQSLLCWK